MNSLLDVHYPDGNVQKAVEYMNLREKKKKKKIRIEDKGLELLVAYGE